jgi:hypothetical protein
MHYPERPIDDTPGKALFDTFGLVPGSMAMIGFGIETTASSPVIGAAAIAVGGLLAALSGKRWHDFHEIRAELSQQ